MSAQKADRREQILDAALDVFAEQGFDKATIKQIARAAGLKSPALIYWYFKKKHEVFQEVLARLSLTVGQAANPATLLDRPPDEVLPHIARAYYQGFANPLVMRVFRLLVSEAVRNPEAGNYLAQRGMSGVLNLVCAYLRRQIELGRMRPHDVASSARAFVGALLMYVFARELFPALAGDLPDAEHYAQNIAAIFLEGLCAPRLAVVPGAPSAAAVLGSADPAPSGTGVVT